MTKIHCTHFPVTSPEAANLLATSHCNEMWENDTTEQTIDLPAPTYYRLVVYAADLLRGSCQLVTDLLWGNWRNGFWP